MTVGLVPCTGDQAGVPVACVDLIEGLTLDTGERLAVRDDNGYSDGSTSRDPIPITVDSTMSVDPAATPVWTRMLGGVEAGPIARQSAIGAG
jgi:hypothetical protein